MTIIALEEHMATPELLASWRNQHDLLYDMTMRWSLDGPTSTALIDLGSRRLSAMDESGIDVAVLSLTTPGLQMMPTPDATAMQGPTNDVMADAIARHPDRFQGFAALAAPDPAAAAAELHRAVAGLGFTGAILHARTGDQLVDEPRFWDIFEAAEHHRAPIYLHPSIVFDTVDAAYYQGLGDAVSGMLKSGTPGWHYETGIVLLRMILRGVFDRFPGLQIIAGHWGEMVLFYLDRISGLDRSTRLQRPIADYFRTNVFITPSGIASQRYLQWAIDIVGAERIMQATDYPYALTARSGARTFLEDAAISDTDRDAIGSGTWNRIVDQIRR